METLNITFYFPYNWYQLRSVKIRNRKTNIKDKVKYAEETELKVSKETEQLTFKIDFYKESIKLNKSKNDQYVLVYFNIQNYLGLLNPKILKIKTFGTKKERNEFCNSLYLDFGKSKILKQKNKANILLGILISIILLFSPFYPERDTGNLSDVNNINLVFILGLVSLISLLLINFNKTITLSSYNFRIYATIIVFIISLFYITSTILVVSISLLTFVLIVRSFREFKKLDIIV